MTAVGKLIGALMASVYAMFIVALPTAPSHDQPRIRTNKGAEF